MKVMLRQTIELYGDRYSVGLRDIPEGHACGDQWDYAVKAGWVQFVDKPAEPVVAVAAEVEPIAEVVVEVEPEAEAQPVAESAEVEPVKSIGSKKK